MRAVLPPLAVVLTILALWVSAVVPMNIHLTADAAARQDVVVTPETPAERKELSGFGLALKNPAIWGVAYNLERPSLPSPHQVAAQMWTESGAHFEGCGITDVERDKIVLPLPFDLGGDDNGWAMPIHEDCIAIFTSRRSIVHHGWVTLSATLLGFVIGTLGGILLAVGIVYNRTMDKSVMPWAIASQTIPILALAPMVIVMLGSIGVQGLLPKSVISAYLSFFPVVVGMVKGLRSPDAMQLDLLRTYNASSSQGFWKLRLPASIPYLFTSLKIGISAALVGAIVGELPTGARAGFGARMLVGDQYGQPLVTWSALFVAAITAAILVGILGWMERRTLRRMGMGAL
ncbi:ABC transporter permease [Cognatiyoonia sp.]|uniref:ABC transporter permease n=1 Tax=Cognatiyoonia sp. TaxID=2211652 RepID=UPI003F69960E